MTLAPRQAAMLRKVELARVVARILRPASGYIRSFQPSPETISEALAIVKRRAPGLADDQAQTFSSAVSWAVVDLEIARHSDVRVKEALAQLVALANAARALAEAWAAAGQLHDALRWQFSGRLVRDRRQPGRTAAAILEGAGFADRAEQFMGDEVWRVVGEIAPLVKALRDCKARRSPFGHAYVWVLALAWMEATGKSPTLTGNRRETKKGTRTEAEQYATLFQELMRVVTPPPPKGQAPIGEAIVRDVVKAFRVWCESAEKSDVINPQSESPRVC